MGRAFARFAQVRGRSGKYLLKKVFANYLPKNVRSHNKQGFGIPLAAWFRGPLADWSRELLLGTESPLRGLFNQPVLQNLIEEHAQARADHGKRLYALSMLALWMKGSYV